MLATFLLSKSTKTQIILPFQRLNITFNVIRTNSSSTSDSSSSDSNSDAEISNKISDKLRDTNYLQRAKQARKIRKIEHELTKAAQILTTTSGQDKGKILSVLFDTINKIQTTDNTLSKSNIDNAKDKTGTINNKSTVPQKSFIISKLKSQQEEIKDVNDKFKRKHKREMKPYIIHKLQSQQQKVRNVSDKFVRKYETEEKPSIIRMFKPQLSKQQEVRNVSDKLVRKYETEEKPSIIRRLKTQLSKVKDIDDKFEMNYKGRTITHKLRSQQEEVRNVSNKLVRKYETQKEPSVIGMLKYANQKKPFIFEKLMSQQKGSSIIDDNKSNNTDYERIFDDFSENTDVPKFKMWDTWEREKLQFSVSKYPTNAFQEMIQWSKEGKLWKFPIDNEQGMEKEQNVHFSKHVFLERELIPWCPPKGPIRHFMELVCVGLSKNPYMTIEEKYDHIMWYKNYFKDKHDLLEKLGVVG